MNTKQLDDEIRSQIDRFLVSISDLVRQAALQAVQEALGTPGAGTSTKAPRRGPGRPRKSTGAGAKKSKAARKGAKPARRARRSSADVEEIAAKVLAHVRANPGQRLEEMGRSLRTATVGLKRPIQVLLADGKLRTEGQKRGTKYFAGKGSAAKPAASKAKPARKKAKKTKAKKTARKSAKRKTSAKTLKKAA